MKRVKSLKLKNFMYYLILFIPLVSATVAGLFGRKIGEKGAGIFTTASIMITSLMAWTVFYEVGICGAPVYLHLWSWIESGLFNVSFGLQYDSVTVVMLVLVTTVSALVHLYSTEYMNGDPHLPRFMSYLSLFTFFMIVLVTSDNLLQLFIGWEGVGLCSYLLINFWYTRIQANKSAIKAMVVNRVGDIGLALAMFAAFYVFKSVDFATIFALAPYYENYTIGFLGLSNEVNALGLITILILIGAVGKSAQVGLHTWLPDAMEGPTPVSALIHAATMVTAGVFLLIRSSPLLEYAPGGAMSIIVIVGAITAFFAATVGLVQNDIKKVIAYSTCSQLGYMVFACGLSCYSTSLFHLFNHGFFKALLFLSAGSVIHAMADEQDMRKLGGLIKAIPFTYSMMLIGSLSLMGFPFMTGFYSKDAILEFAFAKYSFDGTFAHWLGTISALFTAFYSFRLLYLTFLGDTNAPKSTYLHAHESPAPMSIPLVILAFGSIYFGYIFKDMFIGPGTPFFGNAITILPHNTTIFDAEFVDVFTKWIPVIFSIFGATLAFVLYHFGAKLVFNWKYNNSLGRSLYTFLSQKWHFDVVYNSYIVLPAMRFGHNVSYKVIDRGLLEYVGPYGISKTLSSKLSTKASSLQSGLVYNYAFTIFLFSTLFLTFLGYWDYSSLRADLLIVFPLIMAFISL